MAEQSLRHRHYVPPVVEDAHHLRSNTRAAGYLALDVIIVGVCAVAAHRSHSWLVSLGAILVIATRQVALLNITHAATHNALFTSRAINRRLQWLFAYPILETIASYGPDHLRHHAEITKRSPHRFDYFERELRLDCRSALGRTWIVFLRPLLGYGGFELLVGSARRMTRDPRYAIELTCLWLPVMVLGIRFSLLRDLARYWLVPLLVVYPTLNLWSEISDHFNANDDARNHCDLFYSLLFKPHDLFHAIHHRFPGIPFYRITSAARERHGSSDTSEIAIGMRSFLKIVYSGGGQSHV
jgi:fatty acid desaturase